MEVKIYILHPSRKKSSVRAVVNHNGEVYRIPLKESVLVKYWNKKKQRCKDVREYPDAPFINKRLDAWEEIIKQAINSFGLITPTQKMVEEKVDKIIESKNIEAGGKTDNEDSQLFLKYAQKFSDKCDRTSNTKKGYQTSINVLLKYEEEKGVKLRFIDIDINFYYSFKEWMLTRTYTKKGIEYHYTKNYIGKIIDHIGKFMSASRGEKLHDFTGDKHEDFKSESETTDAIILTDEEIEKIFNIEFTEELLISHGYDKRKPNLQRAIKSLNEERDRLLIGCCTALRHSDYSRLKALNCKDQMVSIRTKKGDKKVYIPMHHILRKILERRNNMLPAPISEQKHNEQIKMIGKLAGLTEEVLITKTRGGKSEDIVKQKWEFITSHTARRSGASNMYIAGIDLVYIKDILGHEKIEQTIDYIKVTALEKAKKLLDHPYFTGKKE